MANIHSLPPCGSIYHHCVCVLVCVCVCVCVCRPPTIRHTPNNRKTLSGTPRCVCVCVCAMFCFRVCSSFFFLASQVSHTHTHTEVISSVGRGSGFLFWMPKKKREKLSKKKKIPRNVGLFSFFFHFRGLRRPQWGARGADYDFIFVFLDPFFLVVCVCV